MKFEGNELKFLFYRWVLLVAFNFFPNNFNIVDTFLEAKNAGFLVSSDQALNLILRRAFCFLLSSSSMTG